MSMIFKYAILVIVFSVFSSAHAEYSMKEFFSLIENNQTKELEEWIQKEKKPNKQFNSIPAIALTVIDGCFYDPLKIFIKYGADINTKDRVLGASLVHYAARHTNTSCLELLIEKGASVMEVDFQGETAYFSAIHKNGSKAINLLFEAGTPLTKTNNHGLDPIHYSIFLGQPELFKQVLSKHLKK